MLLIETLTVICLAIYGLAKLHEKWFGNKGGGRCL